MNIKNDQSQYPLDQVDEDWWYVWERLTESHHFHNCITSKSAKRLEDLCYNCIIVKLVKEIRKEKR